MAYATAADFILRYDAKIVGDLVRDDGVTEDEDDLASNDALTAILSSASGVLNAAALQGERYTTATLAALTGDAAAFLKTIVCDIAFVQLWQRKPYPQYNDLVKASAERCDQWLERIRGGAWVFDVDANKDAGTPKVETIGAASIALQNPFVDSARGSYFPARRTNRGR